MQQLWRCPRRVLGCSPDDPQTQRPLPDSMRSFACRTCRPDAGSHRVRTFEQRASALTGEYTPWSVKLVSFPQGKGFCLCTTTSSVGYRRSARSHGCTLTLRVSACRQRCIQIQCARLKRHSRTLQRSSTRWCSCASLLAACPGLKTPLQSCRCEIVGQVLGCAPTTASLPILWNEDVECCCQRPCCRLRRGVCRMLTSLCSAPRGTQLHNSCLPGAACMPHAVACMLALAQDPDRVALACRS